jgi:hypothetical protein
VRIVATGGSFHAVRRTATFSPMTSHFVVHGTALGAQTPAGVAGVEVRTMHASAAQPPSAAPAHGLPEP